MNIQKFLLILFWLAFLTTKEYLCFRKGNVTLCLMKIFCFYMRQRKLSFVYGDFFCVTKKINLYFFCKCGVIFSKGCNK